jgi:hypothetical protein
MITLSSGLLVGCGSSSASTPSTTSPAARSTCQLVNADLSDGPDPGADPVGYALAQIAPLRQAASATSDLTLRAAIDRLDRAYQTQYQDNAQEAGVNATVKSALAHVQALCPAGAS